jgi:glycosyltransferase involved in cell wall biosynthesis
MKILIYSEYFLPSVGGVQMSINLLAEGLSETSAGKTRDGVGRNEVTVATRTLANGMDDSKHLFRVVRRPGIWELFQLIRDANVVHIAGPCFLPLLIAWLTQKPVAIEHHAYQAICPNGMLFLQPSQTVCPGHFKAKQYAECLRCRSHEVGWLRGLRSVLLTFPRRWLCKQVAANVTISDHVGKRIGLPRSQTIYYGIKDANGLSAGEPLNFKGPLQLAFVGRLTTEKGLPLLLTASKSLKDDGIPFHLIFIGDGPERGRLEEMVKRLSLENFVKFTGALRYPDLDRTVSKVEVLVMPSVCEETAGLSAIEQMMRGRVVIAADIGGLGEVVGNAGLRFDPGNSRALASCIRRLLNEPSLAASLGSAARVRAVQLFTQEGMIRSYTSLYQEILR